MSDYIDREKIILKTCSDCTRQVNLVCKHPEPCEKLIAAFLCEEQEDVAPVVHGKWTKRNGYTECSECEYWYDSPDSEDSCDRSKYCPHCGAKMDLTDD